MLTNIVTGFLEPIIPFLTKTFAFNADSPLLFTQFYFWAFFAVVYFFFTFFKSKRLLRNTFLFFVSLFFYYKTSGLFVLILLFSTCSDFFIAKWIDASSKEWRRRAFMILSVCINLFVLAYFKYAYFFTDLINELLGLQIEIYDIFAAAGNAIAGAPRFNVDQIILPVGISFYTFQTISYSVDVYRRRIKPVTNILDFGFYVSFFPQLVAGPIVRAGEFIPQLYKPFFLGRRQMGIAVFWILNGLAKKIIIGDYLAVNFIDRIFDNPLLFSGFENFMALFLYSLQVYADFSGYTDIAIGVAMLMGFYLPKNFNSPYKAVSTADFWHRWHMSLSVWLKEYLYIPLGGNRNATFGTWFWIIVITLIGILLTGSWYVTIIIGGVVAAVVLWAMLQPTRRTKIITYLNLMITMLLGGLWHGASWNFMIWGGLNGVGLVGYKFWSQLSTFYRVLLTASITIILTLIYLFLPSPLLNILLIWSCTFLIGAVVRKIYEVIGSKRTYARVGRAWAILQTFTFITFTRLFFRSGSNLDPAEANQEAWTTAQNMVQQIGSKWNLEIIPDICVQYHKVFILFILGMIIHWLPDHFKRWYRINIALLPLPLLALFVVLVIFIVYQFVTAQLQPFIYFQF